MDNNMSDFKTMEILDYSIDAHCNSTVQKSITLKRKESNCNHSSFIERKKKHFERGKNNFTGTLYFKNDFYLLIQWYT